MSTKCDRCGIETNLETALRYLEEARKLDPKCVLLKRAEAILQDAGIPAG
jgi:hypothetical protein